LTEASAAPPTVPTSAPITPTINLGPPAKLEPLLLLAKAAKGAAAGKLAEQACAKGGVYVFGELLEGVGGKGGLGKEVSHSRG
jgi:hypothetical protein